MNEKLNRITLNDIERFTSEVSQGSTASGLRAKSALRRFFSWAKEAGKIAENPFDEEPVLKPLPTKKTTNIFRPLAWISFSTGLAIFALIAFQSLLPLIKNNFNLVTKEQSDLKDKAIQSNTTNDVISKNVGDVKGFETEVALTDDLTINSSDPTISAPNGNLLLESNQITLSTLTASDGNITFNPDGSGVTNFIFEGTVGNQLSATSANLNSGSLFYGYVGNNNSTASLLKLESGATPSTKFSVDQQGNTKVAGNLTVDGSLDIGSLELDEVKIGGVPRLTSAGRLASITGYYQDSGLFEIDQGAPDFASIQKVLTTSTGVATNSNLTLNLDESDLSTGSDVDTLVISRKGGTGDAYALYIDEGNLRVDGDITYTGTLTDASDIRLKSNINSIKDPLTIISAINGVTYKMNTSGEVEVGVIAQDVQKVLPEAVKVIDQKNGYLGVSYQSLIPVLLEGVKELNHKIENYSQTSLNGIEVLGEGFYKTTNLIAENISAGTIEVGGLMAKRIESSKIVSPVIETNLLSPLPDKDLNVMLAQNSKFKVSHGDKEVASINSNGDAKFAGKLAANNLEVEEDASIKGKLTASTVYADQIVSDSLVSNKDIEDILRDFESNSDLTNEIRNLTEHLASQPNTSTLEDLVVTDKAAIANLAVDSLVVGTDLIIQKGSNSLDTLSSPLQLQSLALAPIELMGGKVRIETNGDLAVNGNLKVTGLVESQNLKTNKLVIAADTTSDSQTIDAEITSNATIGSSALKAGSSDILIKNSNVTDTSLVYITPTSTTENSVLYVKSKSAGQFTVGFINPVSVDVQFNWWVVDTNTN